MLNEHQKAVLREKSIRTTNGKRNEETKIIKKNEESVYDQERKINERQRLAASTLFSYSKNIFHF